MEGRRENKTHVYIGNTTTLWMICQNFLGNRRNLDKIPAHYNQMIAYKMCIYVCNTLYEVESLSGKIDEEIDFLVLSLDKFVLVLFVWFRWLMLTISLFAQIDLNRCSKIILLP